MVYSCAYCETADKDPDTAQARKLDYLCRKLRLRRAERLLDIGQPVTDPQLTSPNFINRYVFPDGELVSFNAALRYARRPLSR